MAQTDDSFPRAGRLAKGPRIGLSRGPLDGAQSRRFALLREGIKLIV
jgi:hypothetical protein